MEFSYLQQRSRDIRDRYALANESGGNPRWGAAEYLQGFVADLGTLSKLVMARNGFREEQDVETRIAHELADCLWSVIILADELSVDLEKAFLQTMHALETRLDSTGNATTTKDAS